MKLTARERYLGERLEEMKDKYAELDALSAGNKEGMVLVTKEDAENYCRILSLLGMEEEGSPVEGVERLISLRDGMTCGDCNDTGWLENREEGRYPCTCMTEAEPYQILQAKCASLDHQVSEGHKNTLRLESVIRDFEAQTKELEAEVERLNKVIAGYERDQEKIIFEQGDQAKTIAQQVERIKELDADRLYQIDLKTQFQRELTAMEAERDALAMQNQQMREALEYCVEDSRQVLTALEQVYGTVYRQDRVKDQRDDVDRAVVALALPDLSAEVIKRHDAEVLRKAAQDMRHIGCECGVPCDCFTQTSAVIRLQKMADELEKSCPPSN